jgi:hypothetical protein
MVGLRFLVGSKIGQTVFWEGSQTGGSGDAVTVDRHGHVASLDGPVNSPVVMFNGSKVTVLNTETVIGGDCNILW